MNGDDKNIVQQICAEMYRLSGVMLPTIACLSTQSLCGETEWTQSEL